MSKDLEFSPSPLMIIRNCLDHRQKMYESLRTNADIIVNSLIGNEFHVYRGAYKGRTIVCDSAYTYDPQYSNASFHLSCRIYKVSGNGFLAKGEVFSLSELMPPKSGVAS